MTVDTKITTPNFRRQHRSSRRVLALMFLAAVTSMVSCSILRSPTQPPIPKDFQAAKEVFERGLSDMKMAYPGESGLALFPLYVGGMHTYYSIPESLAPLINMDSTLAHRVLHDIEASTNRVRADLAYVCDNIIDSRVARHDCKRKIRGITIVTYDITPRPQVRPE